MKIRLYALALALVCATGAVQAGQDGKSSGTGGQFCVVWTGSDEDLAKILEMMNFRPNTPLGSRRPAAWAAVARNAASSAAEENRSLEQPDSSSESDRMRPVDLEEFEFLTFGHAGAPSAQTPRPVEFDPSIPESFFAPSPVAQNTVPESLRASSLRGAQRTGSIKRAPSKKADDRK